MNGKDDKHGDEGEITEEIELTPSEKKGLETLPRNRIPPAALEDRVVGALRDRGLFAPPRRRVIVLTARRIATMAVACLVLMAVGFTLGKWVGARQVAGGGFIQPASDDISVAVALQQSGSAYVMALQRFADLPDSIDGDQAVQGREVALMTLYTAADQVTRLVPKDELARQFLAAIDADPGAWTAEVGGAAGPGKTIEF